MKLVLALSILVVLALLGLFLRGIFIVRGADEASLSVSDADSAVRSAFNATLGAERAGANVSKLIDRLNEAGWLLDEAEVALNSGNSSGAAILAGQCIGIADSVGSDADVLRTSVSTQAQITLRDSTVFSAVSSVAFVIIWVLVWRQFKRRYVRKVLDSKPEVVQGEP